ncbi:MULTISPECIES: response regulator transcription factor [Pontibacter]|uniref:Two component transcriptional regulator, LuxR family n=1 Tax=Pontibacter lucknowensis TaxID=1077936 RepID=A0A1N6W6S1_9BACT|nr:MULTISPECIES: response regulator transcription factor [Pontibacter]EJF09340.1 two component transcriptional regulator, luxr family protein [Pontibacter sp. BAB1700]SIQ85720.1 two component transcriptional regulator, LuxR family [Pontibacter lucknowensis]
MINLLIADDYVLIREGLKKVLRNEPDITVVAEATNGAEVLKKLKKSDANFVVLDINMPVKSGLDVLFDLKRMFPQLPVLILSMYPEKTYALRSLKAGASGYLCKESAAEELVMAIKKVWNGGKYITASLAELLADTLVGDNKLLVSHETLSDREFQIMCKIAEGESLKSISENLSLTLSTVNTYRNRINEKMKFSSNTDLIRYCIQNKLI